MLPSVRLHRPQTRSGNSSPATATTPPPPLPAHNPSVRPVNSTHTAIALREEDPERRSNSASKRARAPPCRGLRCILKVFLSPDSSKIWSDVSTMTSPQHHLPWLPEVLCFQLYHRPPKRPDRRRPRILYYPTGKGKRRNSGCLATRLADCSLGVLQ